MKDERPNWFSVVCVIALIVFAVSINEGWLVL